MAIGGAHNLESIQSLGGSTVELRQVKPERKGNFAGWGNAASQAADFVDQYFQTLNHPKTHPKFKRERILVAATLTASDKHAAATAAYRSVGEALDHYVSGHPFVRFEVDDAMAVIRTDQSHFQLISLRPPSETSISLPAVPWPESLRQAMRVAHLLRNSTAPMTRIALAWVLIESSGLSPADIEVIAKTLALTSLRQAIFMPYRFLVQEALDRQSAKNYRRHSEYLQKSSRRWEFRLESGDFPPSRKSVGERSLIRARFLSGLYQLLEERAEEHARVRRSDLAELDAVINPTANAAVGHRGYLPSLMPWIEVVRSDWHCPSNAETEALHSLVSNVSIATSASIEKLTSIVRSGNKVAQELSKDRDWFKEVLNAFYAARNLNFHSGVFGSAGDKALGESAVLVADSLFETWGNWYSTRSSTAASAGQVIKILAERFDRCLKNLVGGGSIADVDIDKITAPEWHPSVGV